MSKLSPSFKQQVAEMQSTGFNPAVSVAGKLHPHEEFGPLALSKLPTATVTQPPLDVYEEMKEVEAEIRENTLGIISPWRNPLIFTVMGIISFTATKYLMGRRR